MFTFFSYSITYLSLSLFFLMISFPYSIFYDVTYYILFDKFTSCLFLSFFAVFPIHTFLHFYQNTYSSYIFLFHCIISFFIFFFLFLYYFSILFFISAFCVSIFNYLSFFIFYYYLFILIFVINPFYIL